MNGLLIALILGIILFVIVYLLPTIIAFKNKHRYRWIILGINMVFGCTVIVWFALMIFVLNKFDMQESDATTLKPSIKEDNKLDKILKEWDCKNLEEARIYSNEYIELKIALQEAGLHE